jgi:hypothetical protein
MVREVIINALDQVDLVSIFSTIRKLTLNRASSFARTSPTGPAPITTVSKSPETRT